jgi:hypothetical protein
MTPLQKAAEAMSERLLIFHALAEKCRDRGDEGEFMDVRDLWSPADQTAIDAYQEAKAESIGLRPLFQEEIV